MGSNPGLLYTFYQYHLPLTVWVRSLILDIGCLHGALAYEDEQYKKKSLTNFFLNNEKK